MNKEFIPYELAQLAKEKGFDEPCFGYYYIDAYGKEIILCDSTADVNHTYFNEFPKFGDTVMVKNYNLQFTSAPLYQQLVEWLRKRYKFEIIISSNLLGYGYIIYQRYPSKNYTNNNVFQEYYEALDKALEEAFKLI